MRSSQIKINRFAQGCGTCAYNRVIKRAICLDGEWVLMMGGLAGDSGHVISYN